MVVVSRHLLLHLELDLAYNRSNDRAELQVRELLANAPMPARAERLLWALRALADCTKSIIDLLTVLVRIHFVGLRRETLGVAPSCWIPLERVRPRLGVYLGDGGRGEHEVAFWHDVDAVFGGCGERGWDGDVIDDFAHDAVDRRVHTERFANDGIEDGKLLELFVCHWTELALFAGTEVFDLLSVESIAKSIDVR